MIKAGCRIERVGVDRDVGVEVLAKARASMERVHQSFDDVADLLNEDDREWYRKQRGTIIGSIFAHLMEPVYWQYRDLEPPELRATRDRGSK
jgi:hypothetical protein